MSDFMDTPKDLKRKQDHDDRSLQSERKRKKKDGKTGSRPKHYPLSERQQLALLMQMTAEENNDQPSTPTPAVKKPAGSSGRKDKVNKRNERGETSLHIATIRGELSLIIDLVKQGADVNVQDYAGWTPLHEACNHGFVDIAKYLLEAGAIVNSKGFNDDYPLHDAVMNENTELVELLLKHGANPLLSNKQGERPLDLADNEEIKELMQNEILMSDDSDQNDSKPDEKSNKRSDSSDRHSGGSTSRELFKQFDDGAFDKLLTSDSDESDDIPLSRQRRISIQSKSSTSSCFTAERKTSSSGFLETKRSKSNNKRRLFSSESAESLESESKPLKQRYSEYDSLKHILSSDDEFFSPPSKIREDRFSTDSFKSSSEKRFSSTSKRSTTSVSSNKLGESDVYDFSPNSDDFSNESNAISLKSESKASSNKWESQSKPPSLYSRKVTGSFSSAKGADYGTKKNRKPSKDSSDSTSESTAAKKTLHKTSEMLFDRFCKTEKDGDSFSIESKPKPKSIFEPHRSQKSLPSLATSSSAFSTPISDPISSTNITLSSSNSSTTNIFSANFLSPKLSFSSESKEGSSFQKSRLSDPQPNLFKQFLDKEHGTRSLSIDNASLTSLDDTAHSVPDEAETSAPKTSRAISLDSKEKLKKPTEDIKVSKSDVAENKPVKKIKSDNKEKVSKTLSDHLKRSQTKPSSKDSKSLSTTKKTTTDKSKLTKPMLTKKEPKSEKKLTLLSDTNSIFLNDLDKTSFLRQQEKIKRKKLAQKKVTKPVASSKPEDKKQTKKSEVKLIETDSWLGSQTDKTPPEKQRKASQRTTKKGSDASVENDKTLVTASAESDATPKPLPSFSSLVTKPAGSSGNFLKPVDDTPPAKILTQQNLESPGVPYLAAPPFTPSPEEVVIPTILSSPNLPSPLLSSPIKSSSVDDPTGSNIVNTPYMPIMDTAPPEIDVSLKENSVPDETHGPLEETVFTETEVPPTPSDQAPLDGKDTEEGVEANKSSDAVDDSSSDKKEEEEDSPVVEKEPSELEKMLQSYIQERLAANTVELSYVEPLQDRIPLHVLNSRQKDPSVDKLNVIEERLAIRRKIVEKRKKLSSVIPQAPQSYWEYMTFTGSYLLSGSNESRLAVPVLAPPPHLCELMEQLFKAHEEKRVRLRMQHAIQREKLIISCEQEIMRVHSRAARTNQTPFSACAMLMDCEVYTMPRQANENETGKTSIRDRFNTRMYLSWLQDVDDKFVKIKAALLARQRHEAEALHAVQKTEWILKCQEIDRSHRSMKPEEINEIYVPTVNIADDFDLLPA